MGCRNGEMWRQRDHLGGPFTVVQTWSYKAWYDGNQNGKESITDQMSVIEDSLNKAFLKESFLDAFNSSTLGPPLECCHSTSHIAIKSVIV